MTPAFHPLREKKTESAEQLVQHPAVQRSKSQDFLGQPRTVIRMEVEKIFTLEKPWRGENTEAEEEVKISREHLTFS